METIYYLVKSILSTTISKQEFTYVSTNFLLLLSKYKRFNKLKSKTICNF